MELSFSSEQAEYDDDPTAAAAAAASPPPPAAATVVVAHKPSNKVAPLPLQRPAMMGGWGGGARSSGSGDNNGNSGSVAMTAPKILSPVAAKGSTGGGGAGGGFFASLVRSKPTTVEAANPSSGGGGGAGAGAVEEIQSFDPAEVSLSRRAPSSSTAQRLRDKKARAQAVEARRKAREAAAPGELIDDDDDLPRSARKPVAASATAAAAASSSSVTAPAASATLSGVPLGIGNGGGAGKSMIDGMGRKGGKGAFALDKELDFSSDEDEEDGHGGTIPRKKKAQRKNKDEKKSDGDGSSGSGESGEGVEHGGGDVAPLINDVALDFVWRRWVSTLLGGMVVTWSASPSDPRQPGLPGWVIGTQLAWMLAPAIIAIVLNGLHFYEVIERPGIMALIAGIIGATMHALLHFTHRTIMRRTPPSGAAAAAVAADAPRKPSTRVADQNTSSSALPALGSASSTPPAPSPSPSAPAPVSAVNVTTSHDNFEAELQALVKAAAVKAGTLPPKPKPKKASAEAATKKKRADDEDEESASRPPDVAAKKKQSVVNDDDDDDDDVGGLTLPVGTPPLSLSSPALWAFLVSPGSAAPRSAASILFRSVLAGTLLAGACFFLEWSFVSAQYDSTTRPGDALTARPIVYLVFAWISFCVCFYSLNVRAPVEPNQFSSSGGGSGAGGWLAEEVLLPLGRCFYVSIVIVYNLVLRLLASSRWADSISQTSLDVHDVLMVMFVVLPVLFALGTLPPLEALGLWAMEQLNVVMFATTPAANNVRTVAFTIMHTAAAVVVFGVWVATGAGGSHTGATLFAAGLSFLLGWNPLPLWVGAGATSEDDGDIVTFSPDNPFPSFNSRALWPMRLSTLGKIILGAGACGAGLILSVGSTAQNRDTDLLRAIQKLHEADIAFDVVALVLLLVLYVLSEAYRPYMFANLFRNPFYRRLVTPPPASSKDALPRVPPIVSKHEALLWMTRAFMVVYITFHLDAGLFIRGAVTAGGVSRDFIADSSPAARLTLFAYSVLLLRAFNQVWSSVFQSLVHALLVVVVNMSATNTGGWNDLDWTVRFLICGFAWSRLRYDAIPKIWFMCTLTYTSFAFPKLRMRHHALMKLVCAVLLPYHLALVLVSSLLGTPVLPLLGSPVFLMAFPRPQRVWRSVGGRYGMNESAGASANGGPDTVFYRQMFPSVYEALNKALRDGHLGADGGDMCPGDFFLLRLEPYLVWVGVLERGLGYMVLQMKGLELASTSCHTVEALRVDERLEAGLDGGSSPLPLLNPLQNALFAYEPLITLRGIRSFSITKNVLTGIIDDLDNLTTLSATFLRCIIYNLHAELLKARGGAASSPHHQPQLTMASLPPHWTKPTVSNYDLQSVEERFAWPLEYVKFLFAGGGSGQEGAGGAGVSMAMTESDMALFRRVCLSCFAIVETLSSDMVSASGGRATPAHVLRVFQGVIGPSLYSDYILAPGLAEAQSLRELVLRSYRWAFKALYDCAALGSLEVLTSQQDPEQFGEFHALLTEYDSEWLVAPVEGNGEWERAVARGDKKLFSIARSTTSSNQFTSLTLEMAQVKMHLASISPTAIRAFWCSLNLELFYFANDDDERYSIQAHPQLLRNLTVQTSEPPFGYPVFSGLPTILSTD